MPFASMRIIRWCPRRISKADSFLVFVYGVSFLALLSLAPRKMFSRQVLKQQISGFANRTGVFIYTLEGLISRPFEGTF